MNGAAYQVSLRSVFFGSLRQDSVPLKPRHPYLFGTVLFTVSENSFSSLLRKVLSIPAKSAI